MNGSSLQNAITASTFFLKTIIRQAHANVPLSVNWKENEISFKSTEGLSYQSKHCELLLFAKCTFRFLDITKIIAGFEKRFQIILFYVAIQRVHSVEKILRI